MPHITLSEGIRYISQGGLVLYPTETFFAIGCRADSEEAVRRIFTLKQRPQQMPLPLIIGRADQITLAAELTPELEQDVKALSAFWPGPLTLILPARAGLPAVLSAGTGTIALRISSHPAARALSLGCGFPIISTSANLSGKKAAAEASELDAELLKYLSPAKDGVINIPPKPAGGSPSTIVKSLGSKRLAMQREGSVSAAQLKKAGFCILSEKNV